MKRLITTMLTACLLCSCAPRTAAPQDMDTGLERSVMPDRLAASSPAVSSAVMPSETLMTQTPQTDWTS